MASTANHRSSGSDDYGVYDDAKTYYASEERHTRRFGLRTRTYSQVRPRPPVTRASTLLTSSVAAEQFAQGV